MPVSLPEKKIKAYICQLYGRLASAGTANLSRTPILCGEALARSLGYDTSNLPIHKKAWKLFAGCGNPLEKIDIKPHWTVLDVGCGVGIDCQVAALPLRSPGQVIGLEITGELVQRAQAYSSANPKLRCRWMIGDGESLPLMAESVNLAMANGSFNLMPHKEQALAELYRVLKPGGHLVVADLIRIGEIEPITAGLEDAWAWCVAGALSAYEYDILLKAAAFSWWDLQTKCTYGPLAAAVLVARKGLAS